MYYGGKILVGEGDKATFVDPATLLSRSQVHDALWRIKAVSQNRGIYLTWSALLQELGRPCSVFTLLAFAHGGRPARQVSDELYARVALAVANYMEANGIS